jgi:wyosine [tRNA(Phe)-imidazoG37] synthetase (radical SAM superfamily)
MVSQKPRQNKSHYVFGPVPSRRLGRSLGIDLVPYKTCTLNCIYCQLGRTKHTTVQRADFAGVADVLRDLENALEKTPDPDFITLSGSGEPTLHSGINGVIKGIRAMTSLPIAVLTNGTLFNDEKVRASCSLADVVLPSLDAGDQETFNLVNRPAAGLTFKGLLEGLTAFRQGFKGQMWLEVFLIGGVTDSSAAVSRIARAAASVSPDRIHLNTAVRPPAEGFVQPVPLPDLKRYADYFIPKAEYAFPLSSKSTGIGILDEQLLEILKRRPCTLEGMAGIFNLPPVEIIKYVDKMEAKGLLAISRRGENIYFSAVPEETVKT